MSQIINTEQGTRLACLHIIKVAFWRAGLF